MKFNFCNTKRIFILLSIMKNCKKLTNLILQNIVHSIIATFISSCFNFYIVVLTLQLQCLRVGTLVSGGQHFEPVEAI